MFDATFQEITTAAAAVAPPSPCRLHGSHKLTDSCEVEPKCIVAADGVHRLPHPGLSIGVFTKTDVVPLGAVDVAFVATWATAVPYEGWPQQGCAKSDRPAELKPAMINDPEWQGMRARTSSLAYDCLRLVEKEMCESVRLAVRHEMLSVVMPGHGISEHDDPMPEGWVCRVHVPLTTNEDAALGVRNRDGQFIAFHLAAGSAYAVNVRARHAVANRGSTPRLHFVFDVYRI